MLFLTRLAFKNLARHRNRTIITSIIIAFAVFAYILYDSLIGGMSEMSYATIMITKRPSTNCDRRILAD